MEAGGTSVAERRHELRAAVRELTDRGLTEAARWCAEQLVGLPEEDEGGPLAQQPQEESLPGRGSPAVSGTGRTADDAYMLAKAYFDCKEYRRAAAHLKDVSGSRAQFLRCYSSYIAGAKQQEEERVESAGPLGKAEAANPDLEALELELQHGYAEGTLDGYCLYLYALVLIDRESSSKAAEVLAASLMLCPCNWSAWQALTGLCRHHGGLHDVELPTHWATDFFMAGLCLELQNDVEGLERLQGLYEQFPNSSHILMQSATAHYNLRNFDDAEALFQDILQRDPFRIDGMDIFSNILYVKECFAELSHLAHRTSRTDKYRPETCCIIGNYYSLKSQHEKAVMYFRRALKLNSNYLSAWTLMGHEFVEMKNPSAAIDAYRRAVDINPRDYRAWYGLGQAYELITMPYYAIYYFRRATQLRPFDSRMWNAMGQCYFSEQLGRANSATAAAIHCFKRAVNSGDREGTALDKLAGLYKQEGKLDAAAYYYSLNVQRLDDDQTTGSELVKALCFLAEYYRNKGQLAKAEEYCQRLLDFGGPERDTARALLRELHSLQQHAPEAAPPPEYQPDSPGSDLDLSPG